MVLAGLDLGTHPSQCQAMNPFQIAAFAPLLAVGALNRPRNTSPDASSAASGARYPPPEIRAGR